MKRVFCGLILVVYVLTAFTLPPVRAAGGIDIYQGDQFIANYTNFQKAINNCLPGQHLKLQADMRVNAWLVADLYLDLNGHTLSGQIDPKGYTLYGADSATDNYNAGGTFACDLITPNQITQFQDKRYLAIQTDNGWQFHRFYLGITHSSLDTAHCGIGFKGVFWGSDAVISQLKGLEYYLQLEAFRPHTVSLSREELYSGRTISLRVNNWDVENHADTTLSARLQLKLADGSTVDSTPVQLTFRQTIEQIDANYKDYTWEQLNEVASLIDRYPVMSKWGLQHIPPQCLTHTDSDNNGYCDVCTENVLVSFQVVALNDLHGKFNDSDSQIGVDEFTTYIKNARKQSHVILLSSGDMWQGGAESNLTQGRIVTDWMNQLDFVAMTMGNHEYDWGPDPIAANAELAEFPFLGINIYDRSTGNRVNYCDSSVLVDLGDIQVGVIGAIGDCYSSIQSGMADDVYFLTGTQLTNLVKAESLKLRSQGADFIIYSLHDGYSKNNTGTSATSVSSLGYYDMALSNGYVDLVLEGHTHQRYLLKDKYGVYHIQGGGDNSGFSRASVSVNTANGNTSVSNPQSLKTSTYSSLSPDPMIAQLLEKYKDLIDPAYEILGYNARKRTSTDICNLVAQLYLEAGLKKWGSDYDIYLGGGFLQCRSPYNVYAGQVQYQDLMSILPFNNEIVLCRVGGNNLLSKFINTTNDSYYISLSDYGKATTPVNNSFADYYVIVDSYTANYAPNNLTIIDTLSPNTYARDLLAEYIRQGKWAK